MTEFMDWDNITTKATLIDEIKHPVKKIKKENILHSILDFTGRFDREFQALPVDKRNHKNLKKGSYLWASVIYIICYII